MALSIAEFVARIPLADNKPKTTRLGGTMTPSGVATNPRPRNLNAEPPTPLTQSVPRPTLVSGKADPDWDVALKPKLSAPVPSEGLVAPHGTAKPLGALGTFLSRVEEINAIARTQNLELPTLAAEMKANGFDAISLSSSPNDDDLEAANIAEKHLRMTPYAPDREELAPILRRIEWERYIFGCSPSAKYYLKPKEDGKVTLACNDKRVTTDQLQAIAPKFKKPDGTYPTAEEVEDARAFNEHYRQPVLAQMTKDEFEAYRYKQSSWLAYVDPSTTEINDVGEAIDLAEESNGGPEEIGLHYVTEGIVHFEPTPDELWPEDFDATTEAALRAGGFDPESWNAFFDA